MARLRRPPRLEILRRVAKAKGVKPIRFHDMRHSFASNFVMRGGSIYTLQRLLGHTSIQMTERYSHLSPDHLVNATELLDFGTRTVNNVVVLATSVTAGRQNFWVIRFSESREWKVEDFFAFGEKMAEREGFSREKMAMSGKHMQVTSSTKQ